jgi:hypothetical protein
LTVALHLANQRRLSVFNLAILGIVAWPTRVPDQEMTDHEKGGNVMRVIDVRYRVMNRDELRALDATIAQNIAKVGAAKMRELALESPPKDATPEEIEAFHRDATVRLKALTDDLIARRQQVEAERCARLRERVLAFRPEPGAEWQDFKPEELDKLLGFEPYVNAFEDGLIEASRGARAKN